MPCSVRESAFEFAREVLTRPHSDHESYEFEKIDFEKDAKLISDVRSPSCFLIRDARPHTGTQVWQWEGEFNGKAFADGKVFK